MILAAINFLLGAFDAYITQRRLRDYGPSVELNSIIRYMATHLGPYLASIIGVLGPCIGWTYIFTVLNQPVFLAVLIGFNLKRFEIQWASLRFEAQARALKAELAKRNGAAAVNPPQSDVSTSPSINAAPSSYIPTDCRGSKKDFKDV
jgi:hypothetical protein